MKEIATPRVRSLKHERGGIKVYGAALVQAMQTALKAADPAAAELVACECVVEAETKDHADWELIKRCAEHAAGEQKKVRRT